jgi:hypothetical protein
MKTEITPKDSVCPIFLIPADPAQIAADKAQAQAQIVIRADRTKAREAVLLKLGITANEAALLLSQ